MNKKIWIRVRDHRKLEKNEEKKGFLEKYKDVLGALVSIGTLFGFAYVILLALLQYIYSINAAKYYSLNWLYFLREDLVGLTIHFLLVVVIGIFWFLLPFLPFLPFLTEGVHNNAVPATGPNRSGKNKCEIIGHCFLFFVLDFIFCVYFLFILADTINWLYTKNADAFRLGGCGLLVLIGAYAIEYIKLCIKEKRMINIFNKILIKKFKEIFFDAKKIFILVISSLILYFVLKSYLFVDKAIQINNIFIIIIIKMLSFILAQLFFFGILSSKPEEIQEGSLKSKKTITTAKKDRINLQKLNWKEIVAVALWVLSSAIILLSILHVCLLSLSSLIPQNKKYYEIVQLRNTPDYEINGEHISSASNLQAVILYRGSQVLLMNCKITSSSNLVIDTSSYEFQEASQYRFYRKKFKNVTTDKPSNNNQ